MNIINRADLIARFGERELVELTDRHGAAVMDEEVLNRAIADAEAEAAAYLQAAGLKLTTPPKALVIKTCDIARYYLYENAMIQIVEDRYQQALAWFKDVVRNPKMLVDGALPIPEKPSRTQVLPNQPPQNWGEIGEQKY